MHHPARTITFWSLAGCLAVSGAARAFGQARNAVEPRPAEQFVDEYTGDVFLPDPEPVRQTIYLSKTFDDLVFGSSRNTEDVVIDRLEKILHYKVADVARECLLTDAQQRKLRLAGRGDVQHLLHRIRAARKPYDALESGSVDQAMLQKLHAATRQFQQSIGSGPFGEGSILARVLQSDLTPEQFATYVVTDEVQRWGGQISVVVQGDARFRDVTVSGGSFDDERLARLTKLPNLRRLTAELARVSDDGLASLSGVASLEVLDLSRTRISSPGMAHLAGLQNLQILALRNTVVGDDGLAHLAKLSSLRELHLQGAPVTDAGLGHLKGLEQLELLNVGRTRITEAGLKHLELPGLSRLKELGLSNTKISEAGFTLIGNCASLEKLIVIGTQATDTAIRPLRNLKHLRHLLIDQTPLTDDGLGTLAEIASLETLEISSTRVTDVGLLGLRKLSHLKYLNVAATHVTDDGLSEFRRALPDVVVHR